ncbi:MAG: 4Fe-4S dicluster domain-containing protein [Xanthomonadaceae bacterium]|nr:4Fe-4S dicluster domain-containing protein [Xanthomonadaceae bacterium]
MQNQTPKENTEGLPRHWMTMDELSPQYWTDKSAQEKRGQEFFEKPIESLEALEKTGQAGIARRDFLTLMGASMALTATACARRPVNKIIPYVVKPEEITPGISYSYASTFTDGFNSYGILTTNREGRPIKLEGNPDHPVNKGALSVRAQASVLSLYDPDRLKHPVKLDRSGSDTGLKVEYKDADAAVMAALKSAGSVRVLSTPILGETTRKLVKEFLGSFRDGELVEYEPVSLEDVAEAQALSFGGGHPTIPGYSFEDADVVVSLGADFLETWGSSTENARNWAKRRKPGERMSKLISFESMMSITGANSDERYPVAPGDEYLVALAIAHEVVGHTSFAGNSQITNKLSDYTAEKVASIIGGVVTAASIKKTAQALLNAKGKSIVVGGGLSSKTKDALSLQIVITFLNCALGNEGPTVDGNLWRYKAGPQHSEISKLIGEMNAGKVQALIIHGANPVYSLPDSLAFAAALKKVPFVVSVSDRVDETSRFSNFVFAANHYLENWGDAWTNNNVVSLQQPAMAPLFDTRSFEDSLLAWSCKKTSFYDFLRENWKNTYFKSKGNGQNFEAYWEATLQKGVVVVQDKAKPAPRSFRAAAFDRVGKPSVSGSGMRLALYESVGLGDGTMANNAWLQELPDPITSVTWDNYIAMGPEAAKKLGVELNDVVELTLASGFKFELPVFVQPGLHVNTVAVAVGYGRTHVGRVGNGMGVNVFGATELSSGMRVASGFSVTARKTGRRYELAATQRHFQHEGRPLINDVTLAEFKKNAGAAMHTNPHLKMENIDSLSMWTKHDYSGPYRWGMAVDLNSCTGCGACVIACQAENNTPVVGRDRVRESREMHWIRIDRYYSGSPENPDVLFEPMMCQHCENAPCETVCPVIATVHDKEGLNEMVYNRCVGTRYCANNCPYKVRRFNFFDYWKNYSETMNMVYNPDVTVRTRGVMEKCSFCVQRIVKAKDHAKDKGTTVRDGDLMTACQQTCPTDAIVFGNINDANSRVSKISKDARSFRVLEILNNKPSIAYLTKVRNKESEGAPAHGHHS